jgi:hypothetical protein
VGRPSVRGLLSASLAFALIAAAASGTAFSINSVQGPPLTAGAAGAVGLEPCTGAYDITWTVSSGSIVGVRAERIPPSTSSDPGLLYCADMPYAILVADAADVEILPGVFDFSHPSWTVEWTGITDAATGSIDASSTAPVSGSLQLAVGTAVQLAIGPDPSDVPAQDFSGGGPAPGGPPPGGPPPGGVAPTLICDEFATGGITEVITVSGEDFCVHTFDMPDFPQTFKVVASDPLDVEYLVVGGGGGGGATLGGGGAGGGVLTNVGGALLTLQPAQEVAVSVGAAGLRAPNSFAAGASGGNSSFGASLTATGGGGGGTLGAGGLNGGSGGGAGGGGTSGGRGVAGQGEVGGGSSTQAGGGGGGASAAGSSGSDGPPVAGGAGGDGTRSSITGTELLYAAGGGGGSQGGTAAPGGGGGPRGGGSGNASCTTENASFALLMTTGSGGGGGGLDEGDDPDPLNNFSTCLGGHGASGVVIVRYRVPAA